MTERFCLGWLALLLLLIANPAGAETSLWEFEDPPRTPRSSVVPVGSYLYGTTSAGGYNGGGTLFKIDLTQQFPYPQTVSDFGDSFEPTGRIVSIGGVLYGTARQGGEYGVGTIWKFDTTVGPGVYQELITVASFTFFEGGYPESGLLESGGFLYGTTAEGGANNSGTAFKMDLATETLTTIGSFDAASTGDRPVSPLIEHGGLLYGTASMGGPFNGGSIFRIEPSSGVISLVAGFSEFGTNGSVPLSELVQYGSFLYGTTSSGGFFNRGTVFKLDPTTNVLTSVVSFSFLGSGGRFPDHAGLVVKGSLLYGTTMRGGTSDRGTLFEFDPASDSIVRTIQFLGSPYPDRTMIPSGAVLYGVSSIGLTGIGGVFKFDPAGSTIAGVCEFYGSDWAPSGQVATLGSSFFVTLTASPSGGGAVARLDPWSYPTIRSLPSNVGSLPKGGLVVSGGFLFGTTQSGGLFNCGTVFKVNPTTMVISKVADMTYGNGCRSEGTLLESGGFLYGTAPDGGDFGWGSVFRIDPIGSVITKVYSFANGLDGGRPVAGLAASGGVLYGTTPGTSAQATVFNLNPTTGALVTLATLGCSLNPSALVLSGSLIYGVTTDCGTWGNGSIFSVDANSGTVTFLHSFDPFFDEDGFQPVALVQHGPFLYGATRYGGSYQQGTLFRFDPAASTLTTVSQFSGRGSGSGILNGSEPGFSLVSSGPYIYGTTLRGGRGGGGVVFSTNKPPTVTQPASLTRTVGSPATVDTIMTVADTEDAPGTLVITAYSSFSISDITNTAGTVTASVAAPCSITTLGATPAYLSIRDSAFGEEFVSFTVNVLANPAPSLGNYTGGMITAYESVTFGPSSAPSDNGSVTLAATVSTGFTGGVSVDSTTGVVSIANPNAGNFTVTITATDNCSTTFVRSFELIVNEAFSVPENFVAAAVSTANVGLSWSPTAGATSYQIWRGTGAGSLLATTPGTSYADTFVSAGATYIYRIRAIAGTFTSNFTAPEVATTVIFADDPAAPGMTVKAIHLSQLRAAVNAMLAAAGLTTTPFTDPALASGVAIKAIHVAELRTAVNRARVALGLVSVTFTDATLTSGATVLKAAHIQELRNAVK